MSQCKSISSMASSIQFSTDVFLSPRSYTYCYAERFHHYNVGHVVCVSFNVVGAFHWVTLLRHLNVPYKRTCWCKTNAQRILQDQKSAENLKRCEVHDKDFKGHERHESSKGAKEYGKHQVERVMVKNSIGRKWWLLSVRTIKKQNILGSSKNQNRNMLPSPAKRKQG